MKSKHDEAIEAVVAAANLIRSEWTSEWSDAEDAGTATFSRDDRTVRMETGFTGTQMYWTRDDPNRFGKTHLDFDTAVSYLTGDTKPY